MTLALKGRDLQRGIIDLAHRLGWMVAHFPPVPGYGERAWRTPVAADGKGFPDLLLVRDRLIVAEIKGTDRLSPHQRRWLDAFRLAGTPAYVWTPKEWASGEVERILRARSQEPFSPVVKGFTYRVRDGEPLDAA